MQKRVWLSAACALVLGAMSAPAFSQPIELPAPPGGGPEGREGGPRGGPGGGAGGLNIFISPAGKPYRARPGEPYPSAAWFAAADKDHDGKVTREEFRADAEAFFRELDTNHDGVIDGFEISDYEKSVPEMLPRIGQLAPGEGQDPDLGRPGGGRRRVDDGGGGGGRPRRSRGPEPRQGAGLYTFLDQPEPVTVADTDFDGRVSLKEWYAAADQRFDILDAKKQGYLVLSELPKPPAQVEGEKRKEQEEKRRGRGGERR